MTLALIIIAYLFVGLVLVILAERTNSNGVGFYEILIGWPAIILVILAVNIAEFIYQWLNNRFR